MVVRPEPYRYTASMNILLTNDDGIFSPGLTAAAEVLLEMGKVYIIAPSKQKTGSGRSLEGSRDQYLQKKELKIDNTAVTVYHMDCTPALVIKHAFNTVLRDISIDVAVSGINYGENIGYDITMSGTIGAAIECAARGIPAFAVSLQTLIDYHLQYGVVDWRSAQYFLHMFFDRFKSKGGFPGFDICKLDIPEKASEQTEWAQTRLSKQSYFATTIAHPRDDSKLSDVIIDREKGAYETGTDAYSLIYEQKVSVTPLSLDWTATETGDFFID